MSELRSKKYVQVSTVVYACVITALTFCNMLFAALVYYQQQEITELKSDVRGAYTDTVQDLKALMQPYERKTK